MTTLNILAQQLRDSLKSNTTRKAKSVPNAAFVDVLTGYATLAGDAAMWRADNQAAKKELIRQAGAMSEAQRKEADLELVERIGARYGVSVSLSSQRPVLSGATLEQKKGDKAGKAASAALARARSILKIENASQAEAMIRKLNKKTLNSADPVASMLAKWEKLTGGQKRSFLAKVAKS